MKRLSAFVFCALLCLHYCMGQTDRKPISIGLSVTPFLGGLESDEAFAKSTGNGVTVDADLIYTLSSRLHLLIGPSVQIAKAANRANNLRWGDDNVNGTWMPGLSYEEYSVDYTAIGGSIKMQWSFLKNHSRWKVSGGSSVRYILAYNDKLTINESGTLWTPEEVEAEIKTLQFFLTTGLNYEIPVGGKAIFQFGPTIDFGLTEFLSSATPTLLWSYKPTHPVFYGFRMMIRTI